MLHLTEEAEHIKSASEEEHDIDRGVSCDGPPADTRFIAPSLTMQQASRPTPRCSSGTKGFKRAGPRNPRDSEGRARPVLPERRACRHLRGQRDVRSPVADDDRRQVPRFLQSGARDTEPRKFWKQGIRRHTARTRYARKGESAPATEYDSPCLAMPTQLRLQRSRARRELRARCRVNAALLRTIRPLPLRSTTSSLGRGRPVTAQKGLSRCGGDGSQ